MVLLIFKSDLYR